MTETDKNEPHTEPDAAKDAVRVDWDRKDREHAGRVDELFAINKVTLFDTLAVAGITVITVEFNGYGDEGQIDPPVAYAGQNQIAVPEKQIEILTTKWGKPDIEHEMVTVNEAVNTIAWAILGRLHAGWQDGEGAFGEFEFAVEARVIRLDFNARYVETDIYSYEL